MAERKRRKLSKQERETIYQKTNGHCAYCGCELEFKDMQADHVQPFIQGGLMSWKTFFLPAGAVIIIKAL